VSTPSWHPHFLALLTSTRHLFTPVRAIEKNKDEEKWQAGPSPPQIQSFELTQYSMKEYAWTTPHALNTGTHLPALHLSRLDSAGSTTYTRVMASTTLSILDVVKHPIDGMWDRNESQMIQNTPVSRSIYCTRSRQEVPGNRDSQNTVHGKEAVAIRGPAEIHDP